MSARPHRTGAGLRGRLRVLAGLLLVPFARSRAAAGDPHAAFVARAFANRDLAVAAGDQPYGAVVVCGGRVVADGISAVVTKSDSTAHAEMEAIRLARQRLGRLDLSDCTLYGTSRACPMCERAAAQANIARLYHGRSADGGEPPRAP